MAERKADKLGGKGSFLDRLRKRRLAIESGDLRKARDKFKTKSKQSKKAPSY